MAATAPYGCWRSPIAAGWGLRGARRLREVHLHGGAVWWVEARLDGGTGDVLMRAGADGEPAAMTGAGFNVRSLVHEYGGGAVALHDGAAFVARLEDRRVYRLDPVAPPRPIVPATGPDDVRYADLQVTPDGRLLVCVQEIHGPGGEVRNELALLDAAGGAAPRPLVTGADFYASPRVSPDGGRLAWLTWNHPSMPFDGCELWVGRLSQDGRVTDAERWAGGDRESIFQPEWTDGGRGLCYASDRTGWWNLYELHGPGDARPLMPMPAEFGLPLWTLGLTTYAPLAGRDLACAWCRDGVWRVGVLERPGGRLRELDLPYVTCSQLRGDGRSRIVFIGGAADGPPSVVDLNVGTGRLAIRRRAADETPDRRWVSVGRPIAVPRPGEGPVHAFFYAPAGDDQRGPAGELPPLLVTCHGGPTAAAELAWKPEIQYWTSRGFAVVDVNYAGSSGYGRRYRERLAGRWGIADVEDCVLVADHLASHRLVDPARLAIRGASAGGFTVLRAVVTSRLFAAATSYFGIADLESLVRTTHKLEARYPDGLVAPYPEGADEYRRRSPLYDIHRAACPILLIHGSNDRVVTRDQTDAMVAALRRHGLPFAHLLVEGEGHGFRRADSLRRAFETELHFYARVFRLDRPEPLEPIRFENFGAGGEARWLR